MVCVPWVVSRSDGVPLDSVLPSFLSLSVPLLDHLPRVSAFHYFLYRCLVLLNLRDCIILLFQFKLGSL